MAGEADRRTSAAAMSMGSEKARRRLVARLSGSFKNTGRIASPTEADLKTKQQGAETQVCSSALSRMPFTIAINEALLLALHVFLPCCRTARRREAKADPRESCRRRHVRGGERHRRPARRTAVLGGARSPRSRLPTAGGLSRIAHERRRRDGRPHRAGHGRCCGCTNDARPRAVLPPYPCILAECRNRGRQSGS